MGLLQIRKILTDTSQIKFQVFLTITMTLSLKAAGLLALTFCATCLSAAVNFDDLQVGMSVYCTKLQGCYVVSKLGVGHPLAQGVHWVEIQPIVHTDNRIVRLPQAEAAGRLTRAEYGRRRLG